ncbi:MAG TPA: AI-2E family transporter [Porphyromonadaceae bacterium]|jgi:predicted PurR-regulated permease PerM|uniref:AI-2E family transporter n=1 Tax=Limibacterium fermenti TaxID=3229863 RepID=UPI000E87E310|nr:AI-2E family transporter [Porphyromonadaceae bacterium]HBK31238.1 AI-2E family transporter [Porphyromonadaceae bacterium]HBL33953.1 AI-2E family transporter [Porphyromonadaceae bacterium]HBX18872.1 AI-2E family transporter [Porphyromonadaceae bacterium]HBX44379.1 AI-2E family transporter [Porphyromonadaceae bacterium]
MIQQVKKTGSKAYKYILIGLLILLGIIIFKYARPYLSGFLGAATLYILLKGQMTYLTEKRKLGRGLSATLILLEALIFFLVPLTGITFLVIDTISGVHIDPEALRVQINDFINTLEDRLGFEIFTPANLSALPRAGSNILQALGTSIYSFVINIVVILFVLYYMLYSKDRFEKAIKEILPFKEENKQILAEETKLIIQANAIGIPLLAIIQGVFAYVGYLFFGINNALLYGVLTAFATILPIVGTTLIWLPLGISVIVSGEVINGTALLIYGFLVIGGVDNVARFVLQKKLADIHPLITVFGVLIGIPMFGFLGVIFGPLLLSLFILFFNMYRHEYVPGSTAEPRVTTMPKKQQVKIPRYLKKKRKIEKIDISNHPDIEN